MTFAGRNLKLCGRSQQGVTLVELVVVIAIITIMCAVALPFYGNYIANRNLKTAARAIASDVYQTRVSSMSSDNVYIITFNVNANTYTISQCDTNGNNCVAQTTTSPGAVGNGIALDSSVPPNFIGVANQVTFNPRGTVNAGSLQLKNSAGSTAVVTLSTTGRTSVNWNGTLK